MIRADVFQEAGHVHPIAHRALDLYKEQIDLSLTEIAVQIAQHIGRANVQIGARTEIEQNGLRRRSGGGLR